MKSIADILIDVNSIPDTEVDALTMVRELAAVKIERVKLRDENARLSRSIAALRKAEARGAARAIPAGASAIKAAVKKRRENRKTPKQPGKHARRS